MIEVMRWCGLVVVGISLGCTVGEARPEGPAAPAGERPPAEEAPTPVDASADAADAAEMLSRAQLAYEALDLEGALDLAVRIVDEYPGTGSADPARWVAARAAFSLGRYSEARVLAEGYARSQPAGSRAAEDAAALAEVAADALERPAAVPVVGVVLPRTGSRVLVQYGDWVLEGIELAVREAERRQGRSIELAVVDDQGGALTREAVRELERRGAVAIVGPLLPQHLAEAAAARVNQRMLLVSPTLPESPVGWSQSYSVNAGDTGGAQDLARYAIRVGLAQAAILHARTAEHQAQARAFAVEFETEGGTVRSTVPYDSGTTTFDTHMRRILQAVAPRQVPITAADSLWFPADLLGEPADTTAVADPHDPWRGRVQEPFALFVAAPERDVPQIAPQVSFYGLDSAGVQLLGGEAWASAAVRRVVPNRDLERVIAASRFPPGRAEGLADPDFVALYEETYRRSLPNQLPALGFDAANLILQSLPNRMLTPGATALRFELLAGIRGATGVLSVRGGRVVRMPHLVVIRNGRLQAAPYEWDYELPRPRPPLVPDSLREETGR